MHASLTDNWGAVIPEDIVLGPPRTSFASAGRKSGNALDGLQRQDPNPDTPKERNGLKDRFSSDRPKNDRNGEHSRDARPATAHRPRSEKIDGSIWSKLCNKCQKKTCQHFSTPTDKSGKKQHVAMYIRKPSKYNKFVRVAK